MYLRRCHFPFCRNILRFSHNHCSSSAAVDKQLKMRARSGRQTPLPPSGDILMNLLFIQPGTNTVNQSSGCDSFGRVAAFYIRGLQFESVHRKIYQLFTVNCIEKTKKSKRDRELPLLKNTLNQKFAVIQCRKNTARF